MTQSTNCQNKMRLSYAMSFVPQLIQEILDFKSWVQGYLKDGLKVLDRHIHMHFLIFFVDYFEWLVM